jgi:hypothetical protein
VQSTNEFVFIVRLAKASIHVLTVNSAVFVIDRGGYVDSMGYDVRYVIRFLAFCSGYCSTDTNIIPLLFQSDQSPDQADPGTFFFT